MSTIQFKQAGRPLGRRALWAAVGLAAGFGGVARADEAVQAVWKRQELTYTYQGFTSTYTCDGLRDKVRNILLALGANKDDLRVYSTGCIGDRPSPAPTLRMTVTYAVPVGEAGAVAADDATGTTQHKSKHKSVDKPLPTAPFAATWKTVSLAPRPAGALQIEAGDCELIEQLRDRLFPKLGVRIVSNNVSCIPHQLSLGQPDLKVQVLAPVSAAKSTDGSAPT